jgi:hypothetical protein
MKTEFAYVGRFSDSGSRNSFYKMKKSRYGFKSFPNKELADFAHSVQNALSAENLAPKVYSPVSKIRIPNYITVSRNGKLSTRTEMVLSEWGYLTEIAKLYACDEDCYGDCCGDCAWNNCCKNHQSILDLLADISDMGLHYTDCHEGNLGWVTRRGKKVLVVIDVGRESIGEIDTGRYNEVSDHCYDYDGAY